MPFPLAHPAAILPLRRWCPKYFDLPALIVGSLIPDLAAAIDDWEYFSHSIPGIFVFCLPVGLLTLWIFHRVRTDLVATLPNPHRDTLFPLCAGACNSRLQVFLSLLVGSGLHITWDMFTHDHGLIVKNVAFLSFPVAGVPLNHLFWLLSSLTGSALLVKVYLSLLRKTGSRILTFSPLDRRAYALWCGILVFPFAAAIPLALHDSGRSSSPMSLIGFVAMDYMVGSYLALASSGFVLKLRSKFIKGSET
jgi:hypothetical protein